MSFWFEVSYVTVLKLCNALPVQGGLARTLRSVTEEMGGGVVKFEKVRYVHSSSSTDTISCTK